MTDKDIIKALECCQSGIQCQNCPLLGTRDCMTKLYENALALINRQQAEIEALKLINSTFDANTDQIREIAIKEFIYKLKSIPNIVVYKREIDAIAEEMGVRVDV